MPDIRNDFSKEEHVDVGALEWVPSPAVGVERRMLERIGDEVARASTVVRFAKGRSFDHHVHTGGEEYLVLEGCFSDSSGDYRKGTYVRNKINSAHQPWAGDDEQCQIFVKLRQMWDEEEESVVVDMMDGDAEWTAAPGGGKTRTLFHNGKTKEHVWLLKLDDGERATFGVHEGGMELLVLEGGFSDADAPSFGRQVWHRFPTSAAGRPLSWTAGPEGALVWVKSHHLDVKVLEACGYAE